METKLQWQSLKRQSEQCLDQRNSALTCILHPSDLLVPGFKLEELEVLEYIRMSDKAIGWLEKLEGQKCHKDNRNVELDLIFELANVTEDCSYLWSSKIIVQWNKWNIGTGKQ